MNRTWMPMTAGILSIVAGALSLLGGFFTVLFFSYFISTSYWNGSITPNLAGVVVWLAFLPYLIICAVAIAGGVYAIRRQLWGLALAGSICALLTGWAWPIGVAAIVFVVLSKGEFDHTGPPDVKINRDQ